MFFSLVSFTYFFLSLIDCIFFYSNSFILDLCRVKLSSVFNILFSILSLKGELRNKTKRRGWEMSV